MSDWYTRLLPLLCRLPAETAHKLALTALERGLVPAPVRGSDPILRLRAFGRELANPIGLAAGFDKNARVFARIPALGFGFAEVGGITPLPQAGNPRPRLFRLVEDRALINRMGFNNDGLDTIARRLERHAGDGQFVAANLASNTNSSDPLNDFVVLAKRLAPLVELLVVDVSCPNTANGKMFQRREPLRELLTRLGTVRGATPMALKVSPDLTDEEKSDIVELALAHGVDGMVVANTTIARPPTLRSAHKGERGGLSGPPVKEMSRRLLGEVYRASRGKLTLIGVGGIESGADAYASIRAGASLVQLYTALVYRGPMQIPRIKAELAYLLRQDGFDDIAQAIGVEHGQKAVEGQTA